MPYKPKVSQATLEELARVRDSRHDREQRVRKITVIGTIAVVAAVVLLVAAFLLSQYVIAPNRAVVSVGGENITVVQLQNRIRLELSEAVYNYNQLAQQIQQMQAQATSDDPNSNFLVQFYGQQLQQIAAKVDTAQLAKTAQDNLVKDVLVRQEARRRGISVTAADVQDEMENSIGFYRVTLTPYPTYTPAPTSDAPATPTAAPLPASQPVTPTQPIDAAQPLTPTETPTPFPTVGPPAQPTSISQAELDQVSTRGKEFYTSLGYPDTEFQRVYESSLISKKLQEAIGNEVLTQTQHYQFSYIRFNNVESATVGLDRLKAGVVTFGALISETNAITLPAVVGSGSTRDWTSKNSVEQQYGNEVLAALEATPLNTASPVITSTSGGYYLLQPAAREVRPYTETELSSIRRQAYDDWLTKMAADANVVQKLIDPTTLVPSAVKKSVEDFQTNYAQSGQ